MSIGDALLTRENLDMVRRLAWKLGRPRIVEMGRVYYNEHPDDVEQVVSNLRYMGLSATGTALDEVLDGISIHYYEKLFALTKRFEAAWIARNRMDMGDSVEMINQARAEGKGLFLAHSHFGATYLMASALMVNQIPVVLVGKFPDPVGPMMDESIKVLVERYGAAPAKILNLADPTVDVPMQMMVRMRKGEVVCNVFDENNQFSKQVNLLQRRIMGGTGMDLLLRSFRDENLAVMTPFLVRTSDETFRYEVEHHSLSSGDIIDSFFGALGRRVKEHPEQWYFIHELHEAIPQDSPVSEAGS